MSKIKLISKPLMIFIISSILGLIISFFISDAIYYGEFSKITVTSDESISAILFILPYNLLLFLIMYFLLKAIWLLNNKFLKKKTEEYSKVDSFLYYIINTIYIFKIGFMTAFLVYDTAISYNESIMRVYLLGILPHGVLEILAFGLIYIMNDKIIKQKNFTNFKLIEKNYLLGGIILIILASIIESFVTLNLFNNL